MMKTCTKCRETKSTSEFHKRSMSPDGFRIYCKACVKIYNDANKERVAPMKKAWREANRERLNDYSKAYYYANREERLAYQKAWKAANKKNT